MNNLTEEGAGFMVDSNIVKILHKDGRIEELSKMLKKDLANEILDRIYFICCKTHILGFLFLRRFFQ